MASKCVSRYKNNRKVQGNFYRSKNVGLEVVCSEAWATRGGNGSDAAGSRLILSRMCRSLADRTSSSASLRDGGSRASVERSWVVGGGVRHRPFADRLPSFQTVDIYAADPPTNRSSIVIISTALVTGTIHHRLLRGIAIGEWVSQIGLRTIHVIRGTAIRRCTFTTHYIKEITGWWLDSWRGSEPALLRVVRLWGSRGCCSTRGGWWLTFATTRRGMVRWTSVVRRVSSPPHHQTPSPRSLPE